MKTGRLVGIVRRVGMICTFGALAGCSTYTVQQTNLFSKAGASVATALKDADQANITAENQLRKNMLALNRAIKPDPVTGDMIFVDAGPDSGFASGGGRCSFDPGTTTYLRYVYGAQRPGAAFIYNTSKPRGTYEPYLAGLKASTLWSPAVAASCDALRHCEENPRAATCDTTCYSVEESTCLSAFANFTIRKEAAQLLPGQGQLDSLGRNISAISYPLQAPLKSQVATDALTIVSQYLDLLQKAQTPQPTTLNKVIGDVGGDSSKSIADNATTLATNVSKLRSKYSQGATDFKKLEPKLVVPSINGVSDANLSKELGAFGQLLDTLNAIAQAAAEAKQIGAIITQVVDADGKQPTAVTAPEVGYKPRWQYVDDFILLIRDDLVLEEEKTFSTDAIGNDRLRQVYGEEFKMAHNAQERADALTGLANSPTASAKDFQYLQAQIKEQIPDLLNQMKTSHDDLVQLVIDPNGMSADKKRERLYAGFEQLRTVGENIAAIAALYK